MAYIPDDAEWYIAELIMECQVEDNQSNVIHVNITLIHADSPEDAFYKAEQLGRDSEDTYLNPDSKTVKFIYRGMRDLYVVYDKLEHGAELIFEEQVGVPEEEIKSMITSKSQLTLFRPIQPKDSSEPNYSHKDIMEEVEKRMIANSGNDVS